jgi:ankyrin repeat protein
MKTKILLPLFLLAAMLARGETNNLATLLQQGLFEEQANRNLDAAIVDYQSLAAQFDKDRQLAATAVFRLGECYRAQNKTNEAAVQYQRVLRDFADQQTLSNLSRQNLTALGAEIKNPASAPIDSAKIFDDAGREIQRHDEDREIHRLQQTMKDSPDLVVGADELCQAAAHGQLRVATFLLDHGANINDVLKIGGLFPNLKGGDTPLIAAVRHTQTPMIEFLLDRGADVNLNAGLGTALSVAAENGYETGAEILLAHKADINVPHRDSKETPLFVACDKGFTNLVDLFLTHGADVNAANRYGSTPLLKAVQNGQLPLARMLLAAHADMNIENNEGRTALSYAADYSVNFPEMLKLLLTAKADPNIGKGNLPLMVAVNNADIGAAKLLLENGANPNIHDHDGNTPLHEATFSSKLDKKVIVLLLENKADPNVRNRFGRTPLDSIRSVNMLPDQKTEIIALLHQYGALDKLPDWNSITVARSSSKFSSVVFKKDTNDWNQFTLLESILNSYEVPLLARDNGNYPGKPPQSPPGTLVGYYPTSTMPFPDLAHVTVVRPSHDSTNEMRLTVNLLDGTNGIDCSKDMPLQFGDVVEIPEREHALSDPPVGLTDDQRDTVANHLKGRVQLMAHNQKIELSIDFIGDRSTIGVTLNDPEAQKFLLSSSDLSRVKVIRRDSKSGKNLEWIMECHPHSTSTINTLVDVPAHSAGDNSSDFHVPPPSNQASGGRLSMPTPPRHVAPIMPLHLAWTTLASEGSTDSASSTDFRLRDGDVIEVPEKQ